MSKQKTLVALALLGSMALVSEPIFAQAAQSSSGPGASPSASLDQDTQDAASRRSIVEESNHCGEHEPGPRTKPPSSGRFMTRVCSGSCGEDRR